MRRATAAPSQSQSSLSSLLFDASASSFSVETRSITKSRKPVGRSAGVRLGQHEGPDRATLQEGCRPMECSTSLYTCYREQDAAARRGCSGLLEYVRAKSRWAAVPHPILCP